MPNKKDKKKGKKAAVDKNDPNAVKVTSKRKYLRTILTCKLVYLGVGQRRVR